MTISFASASGNFYNRMGKIANLLKLLRADQTAQNSAMTDSSSGVVGQFAAEPDVQAIMGNSYLGILGGYGGGVGGIAQQLARATVNRMVFRDNARLGQSLTSDNTLASLQEIIRQMKGVGASVLAMTVAGSVTAASNPGPHFTGTGNGAIAVSVKRPLDGRTLENAFAENVQVLCTNDSFVGGATEDNEGFTATGTGNQPDVFAHNWPLGSNGSVGLSAVNGNADNSSGNLLTNSGFDTWASNIPSKWTLPAGVAGTDISQQGGIVYDGTSSLQFTSDGTTTTTLRQQFNSSDGTTAELEPLSQYAFCVWARRDSVQAAGTLRVALVDSGGTVINDQAGVANSFNIDLASLTVNFAPFTGVFRTPIILPSTYSVELKMTTPQAAGRAVFFDKAGLGLMSQLYTGGPYLAVFAGSTAFVVGDYGYVSITNSRGAGGTLDTFQTAFYRLLPEMGQNDLLLPSNASPTVSDGLIA